MFSILPHCRTENIFEVQAKKHHLLAMAPYINVVILDSDRESAEFMCASLIDLRFDVKKIYNPKEGHEDPQFLAMADIAFVEIGDMHEKIWDLRPLHFCGLIVGTTEDAREFDCIPAICESTDFVLMKAFYPRFLYSMLSHFLTGDAARKQTIFPFASKGSPFSIPSPFRRL